MGRRTSTVVHSPKDAAAAGDRLRAIIANYRSFDGFEVFSGFQGVKGDAQHPGRDGSGALTVTQVATANQYGIDVPERPFMSIAFATYRREWARRVKAGVAKVTTNDERRAMLLRRAGLMMVSGIKATIKSNIQPPNSEATIAAKRGSTKTLIDTAQMLNSTRAAVRAPDGSVEPVA